jgi:hypothetical protein
MKSISILAGWQIPAVFAALATSEIRLVNGKIDKIFFPNGTEFDLLHGDSVKLNKRTKKDTCTGSNKKCLDQIGIDNCGWCKADNSLYPGNAQGAFNNACPPHLYFFDNSCTNPVSSAPFSVTTSTRLTTTTQTTPTPNVSSTPVKSIPDAPLNPQRNKIECTDNRKYAKVIGYIHFTQQIHLENDFGI